MRKITATTIRYYMGKYAAGVDFVVTGGKLDHCIGEVVKSLKIPGLSSPFTYLASHLTAIEPIQPFCERQASRDFERVAIC